MTRFRLGRARDLPAGCAVRVDVEGRPVALFNVDGEIRAVDDECRHHGGPLSEGTVTGRTVECPWHRWRYDLRTGERVDRRGSPVAVHRIDVSDGWIYLEEPEQ